MDPKPKFIRFYFFIVISIIIIIITSTIGIYFADGRINFNGIDKDYFGQFGEFISGIAGTLINFTAIIFLWLNYNEQKKELEETKSLTRLQINLSMKPDLYIGNTDVFVFSESNDNDVAYPLNANNFKINDFELKRYNPLMINLINIGVATAKNIKYKWIYDLREVETFIKSNFILDNIEIKIETGKSYIEIKIPDGYNVISSAIFLHDEQRLDIILPYKGKDDIVKIYYPDSYFKLFMIAIQLSFKQDKFDAFKGIPGFPPAILEITYTDLAGNSHLKQFNFDLIFGSFSHTKTRNELVIEGQLIGREVN
jgi:hypothetical protein